MLKSISMESLILADTIKQYRLYKEDNVKELEDYTYNKMTIISVLESLGYDVENNMGTYYFASYIMNYITGEAFNHCNTFSYVTNSYNNAYIRKCIDDALNSFDESKRNMALYNEIINDDEIHKISSEHNDLNFSSILLKGIRIDNDILAYGIAKYVITHKFSRTEVEDFRVKKITK